MMWLDKISKVTICTSCNQIVLELDWDGSCPHCGCEMNIGPRLLTIGEILQQGEDIFYPDMNLGPFLNTLFGVIDKILKGETK